MGWRGDPRQLNAELNSELNSTTKYLRKLFAAHASTTRSRPPYLLSQTDLHNVESICEVCASWRQCVRGGELSTVISYVRLTLAPPLLSVVSVTDDCWLCTS